MARQPQVQYVQFYTAGSAAYRYDPEVFHKKTEVTLPKPRRKKRIVVRLDPVTAFGIGVALVLLIMMCCGVGQLAQARQQQRQMAAYVQTLEEKNATLQATYEAGYDLDEIYEIAITMGMVPAEQAQHIQVQLPTATVEEEPSGWENFCIFLSGLFA